MQQIQNVYKNIGAQTKNLYKKSGLDEKFEPLVAKVNTNRHLTAILIIAVIGTFLLTFLRAATTVPGFEAESATLAGSTCIKNGGDASAGAYIEFGDTSCSISGDFMLWHKVTLLLDGPQTSETASDNPFANYRLNVTFTNGDTSYTVPGFYAADGNAAESSATSGNKWQVNFTPDSLGTWSYKVSFRTGTDVAVSTSPTAGTPTAFDGSAGTFSVGSSDKSGFDFRGKGRLEYVGEHYLRHASSGEYFVKAGPDSPESTLDYEDFDATPNANGKRKSWGPHQQDYVASDASSYTWQNGKGSEFLGAIRYLSEQGMNAFSFLTFSLDGDDDNVYPHLSKTATPANSWDDVYHDRFDVSKLAQWEKIFEYADKRGMYLHFKTLETENDTKMDGSGVGRERKMYYRELIARFSHHLGLNWNIGEETSLSVDTVKSIASYLHDVDPYDHNIVIHTLGNESGWSLYAKLTGNQSELTGPSLFLSKSGVHEQVLRWVVESANSGKKWIVANDEQGAPSIGVNSGSKDNHLVRHQVLWGALMAGGAGVEYYYGHDTGCGDQDCQDHRTRAEKWADAKRALHFFRAYLPYWQMKSNDGRTNSPDDYVLEKVGDTYAVYLPNGGTTSIDLSGVSGTYKVQWYDSRTGGNLQIGSVANVSGGGSRSIGNAPSNNGSDWAVLITKQ